MLIPNTKVKFKNALIAGVFTGTGFLILQWIFVSGQMYVSKYNAIYGSFSFLPLLLIWLQFTWVIILSGIAICYSSQSIYRFNFSDKINIISKDYRSKITLAMMAIIVRHFDNGNKAITLDDFTNKYDFPPRIAIEIIEELVEAQLVSKTILIDKDEEIGLQPAVDINKLSIAYVLNRLDNHGASGFVPNFNTNFSEISKALDNIESVITNNAGSSLIKDIDIKIK
jgi:membrane protein